MSVYEARGTGRSSGSASSPQKRKQPPQRPPASKGLPPLAEKLAQEPVNPTFSPIVITGLVRFAEAAGLFAAGIAALLAFAPQQEGWFWLESLLLPAIAVAAVIAFEAAHLYSVPMFRTRGQQAVRLFAAWSLAVFVPWTALVGVGYTAPAEAWLIGWWVFGLIVLIAGRSVLHVMIRKWTRSGRLLRRTAIVGGGPPGETLVEAINANDSGDVAICGVFDDRTDDRSRDLVGGLPKLGTVDDLVEFARRTRLDLVIFTLPITAEARILQMLKKLSVLPVDIRLSAHTNKLQFRPRSYSYVGAVPVIDIFDKPIAHWDVVIKSLFDRVVGGLLLLALLPVMAAAAIAIKIDSRGPILFRQKRYGFNNELIEVFKFRSMYVEHTDPTAAKLVSKNDPRVTRIGHFLRRSSIDELPQLFNVVFKGNLSLVGPRPHAVHAKAADRLYDQVVDGYFARHRVKPGITGWAQINGWRGETNTREKIEQRVEHDLYYIENWSVLLDLKILALTPTSLLSTGNAY